MLPSPAQPQTLPASLPVIARPSPNHNARPDGQVIDFLILHYTGMTSAEAALQRLCDPAAEVSAHYLIDEDGTLYQLVDEQRRAWHAGLSFWRGMTNLNARSIGIELVNPGHEFGYRPFPEEQMQTLIALACTLLNRYPAIAPHQILGHSDIAPTRKQDPGEFFNWKRLAAAGIGLWPDRLSSAPGGFSDDSWADLLHRWGFQAATASDLQAATIAFQRHFRPANLSGVADSECFEILTSLLHLENNVKNKEISR